MKGKRNTTSLLLLVAGHILMVLVLSAPAMAQCAMCKNSVTGSPSAARLSESLNAAIIVLLIPPVLIFCGIFLVAYRHRKARGSGVNILPDDERLIRDGGHPNSRAREMQNRSGRDTGGALA